MPLNRPCSSWARFLLFPRGKDWKNNWKLICEENKEGSIYVALVIPVLVPARKRRGWERAISSPGIGKSPGVRFSKDPETFRARNEILKLKPDTAAQFLAHKPINFASSTNSCIVLHILKITETSILNANTTKTKKNLSGPEKLRRLSGNRPLGTRMECTSMAHGQRMVYQAQYYLKHSWGPYTRRDVFSS